MLDAAAHPPDDVLPRRRRPRLLGTPTPLSAADAHCGSTGGRLCDDPGELAETNCCRFRKAPRRPAAACGNWNTATGKVQHGHTPRFRSREPLCLRSARPIQGALCVAAASGWQGPSANNVSSGRKPENPAVIIRMNATAIPASAPPSVTEPMTRADTANRSAINPAGTPLVWKRFIQSHLQLYNDGPNFVALAGLTRVDAEQAFAAHPNRFAARRV